MAAARGEGRGAITPDGCAVELYLRFPYRGELDVFASHLPPAASVLDLGCGVGRLTRALLDRGHAVTAVDNSADMLRHVPDQARKVQCDIERLHLAERFDVVLLSSNLINAADREQRHAQLVACRRHMAPGGRLVFERFDPEWIRSLEPGDLPGTAGEVRMAVERIERDGDRFEMSLLYACGQDEWRHHFTAEVLDDAAVAAALDAAGLSAPRWLTRRWGVASRNAQ